jgi:predicted secreted protein
MAHVTVRHDATESMRRGSTSGEITACGSASGVPNGGVTAVPGTVVKPCPGGAGGVTDSGQPDPILTETAPSGIAPVGQIVQMRVAAEYRWSLAEPTASLATQINGDYDEHAGVCFWILWTFRAVSPGSASITVTGANLCEPQQACPGLVCSENFTVEIA